MGWQVAARKLKIGFLLAARGAQTRSVSSTPSLVRRRIGGELIINLKTAKAIGLTIPESFLARADEVIE